MINIESCCSDPEPAFRKECFNKKVVDFLSGVIKRKSKRQGDNNIPEGYFHRCQYDNRLYHDNIFLSVHEVKKVDCHGSESYDVIPMYLSPDKIKKTVFENNIPDNTPQDDTIAPEEAENMPAEKEVCPGGDCGDTNSIPEQGTAVTLPEQPVFMNYPLSGVSAEREDLPLRHYEQGKMAQEKTSQTIYHSGKNNLSPELSRADYYCSYHFRQKYQSPEPVHIYRDNPGVFKLEIYSDHLKRRLKSSVNINGIDNIDII